MQDNFVALPRGVASTSAATVWSDAHHESEPSAVTVQTSVLTLREINDN